MSRMRLSKYHKYRFIRPVTKAQRNGIELIARAKKINRRYRHKISNRERFRHEQKEVC